MTFCTPLRLFTRAVIGTLLLAGVSACVPLMVGGAFTTAMVASDRRTSGTVVEDNAIALKASSRVSENLGERAHVDATSYNRHVLLTGEVPTQQDKQLVEKLVADVENVRKITNELGVMGNSTLGQRSSDLLVATRVRARLVDARDLPGNVVKLVVERGVVYALGKVTAREAKRLTEIIRSVDGVQRLVVLWEVISEEELARLQPPVQAEPATR